MGENIDNQDIDIEKENKSENNIKNKKRKLEEDSENGEEKKPELTSEEDERMRYRKQLSRLSVEEILKLKETLGEKIFNSRWSGNKKSKTVSKKEEFKPEFKRENKN